MCGIFGYVGNVPSEHRVEFIDFLTRAAVFTSERGMHATGFAAYYSGTRKRRSASQWAKAPEAARTFVRGRHWRGLSVATLPESFVGHCRYSTGSTPKVNANNHPFTGRRFALVHNGRVSNRTVIEEAYEVRCESDTDSEVLLRLTELCGDLVVGSRECLDAGEGGIACATLDKLTGKVALFRNDAKPMHAVFVPRWRALVYASTPSILGRALVDSPTRNVDRSSSWVHYGSEGGGRSARSGSRSVYPWLRGKSAHTGSTAQRGPFYVVPRDAPAFARKALGEIVSLRSERVYVFSPYSLGDDIHDLADHPTV